MTGILNQVGKSDSRRGRRIKPPPKAAQDYRATGENAIPPLITAIVANCEEIAGVFVVGSFFSCFFRATRAIHGVFSMPVPGATSDFCQQQQK